MKFDYTKPVKTRSGNENVKILGVDNGILTYAFKNSWGGWSLASVWPETGLRNKHGEDPFDLVNIPVKRKIKYWVNIYENTVIGTMTPQIQGENDILARKEIEIEFIEGEGL